MHRTSMRLIAVAMAGLALVGAGGCAALLVGAAAGAGAVAYVDNELRVTREVTLESAWVAANAAIKDMEYTVIPAETHKDKTRGVVQGRTAADQVVRIEVRKKSERSTEIRVRVGTFELPANRSAEELLYEKMSAHL